ncbi:hypothetical protein AB0F59_32205 [Micromonospora lupini]|uniref:hypothetical protein n=1 Tax=Micromonospora lupini TaxID=285679 RepID=UPI0033DA90B4
MPEKITFNHGAVDGMGSRVNAWRAQTTSARSGSNPNDAGHPNGKPWASLSVNAGSDTFTSGAFLKKRVGEVGAAVDKLLAAYETLLGSTLRTGLRNAGELADETEKTNVTNASRVTLPQG